MTRGTRGGPPQDPYHCKEWGPLRLAILQRDGNRCQVRGPNCKGAATTVDHIIPWLSGGAWLDPLNLRAACTTCNYGRSHLVAVDRSVSEPSRDW